MRQNRWIAAVLAATCLFTISACGQRSTTAFPGTPDTDTVVVDITSEPSNLDPLHFKDGITVDILRHSMSGLARLDKDDRAVPDMAERWESNENLTATTVYLRKDAKWANGDSVTAHDFYFSWLTQMNPDTGSYYADFLYSKIKNGKDYYDGKVSADELGVKVLDDYTLYIEWEHPMTSLGFYFSLPAYMPVNQKFYEEVGAENFSGEANTMLSNGAYIITEWVHDDHILLEKNPDYYDAGRIKIDKIKLVMIGDSSTRVNSFMAGELDMGNLYSDEIGEITAKDPTAVSAYDDGGAWYINFNLADEQLSNLNLRKALAYSLDVQSLLDNVIKDGSVAAAGFVPDAIAGVDGSYAEARGSLFTYDPDAGKAYLETALQELGCSASDIKLSLMCNDSSYSQTQAAYLQEQWRSKLGIEVEIAPMAWKARVEAQDSGSYDLFVEGWGPSENDAITYLEHYLNGYSGYDSAQYQELLAKAIDEGDPAKRQEYLIAAEKQLIDDMAIGPMYFTRTTYAISSKLTGVARTPFQIFNFCDGAAITK